MERLHFDFIVQKLGLQINQIFCTFRHFRLFCGGWKNEVDGARQTHVIRVVLDF